MEKIDPKTQTNGYCQFSGGGDLCLYSNSQTLVVKGLTDENDEKNDDGGLSPIYNGDSISTTISIEGKRGECSYEKLTYQLYANVVLASVTKFIDKLQSYNEEDIETVDKIQGYGIIYTGFGDVGFYKLRMTFGQPTTLTTKCKLAQLPQPYAAGLVDHLLDYYFKKLEQYLSSRIHDDRITRKLYQHPHHFGIKYIACK